MLFSLGHDTITNLPETKYMILKDQKLCLHVCAPLRERYLHKVETP